MKLNKLSALDACSQLGKAGLSVKPEEVKVQAREERWLVHLPNEQMAWFARSDEGQQRLSRERKVLKLLEARCSFEAPRILYESEDGRFDLRAKVPGLTDPRYLYNRLLKDPELTSEAGQAIGSILAEQHTQISIQDTEGWLPRNVVWPMNSDWIRHRVKQVVSDSTLLADIEKTLILYESLQITEQDRVLVHTDIGFHNLVFVRETLTLRGIFDYDGAAWADRHHDFRYLIFDFERPEMLEAALAVYEPIVKTQLSRQRIWLYNATCAISYLAYRLGTRPEEKSCGRTLAEDINWTHQAICALH